MTDRELLRQELSRLAARVTAPNLVLADEIRVGILLCECAEMFKRLDAALAQETAALYPHTAAALHPHTDQCGFDRSGSHNAGRYVCMCGWEDKYAYPPPQPLQETAANVAPRGHGYITDTADVDTMNWQGEAGSAAPLPEEPTYANNSDAVTRKDYLALRAVATRLQAELDWLRPARDGLSRDLKSLVKARENDLAERDQWRIALMGLTAGGSEFTSPNACVAYVRQVRDAQHDAIVHFKRGRDLLAAAVRDGYVVMPTNPVWAERWRKEHAAAIALCKKKT